MRYHRARHVGAGTSSSWRFARRGSGARIPPLYVGWTVCIPRAAVRTHDDAFGSRPQRGAGRQPGPPLRPRRLGRRPPGGLVPGAVHERFVAEQGHRLRPRPVPRWDRRIRDGRLGRTAPAGCRAGPGERRVLAGMDRRARDRDGAVVVCGPACGLPPGRGRRHPRVWRSAGSDGVRDVARPGDRAGDGAHGLEHAHQGAGLHARRLRGRPPVRRRAGGAGQQALCRRRGAWDRAGGPAGRRVRAGVHTRLLGRAAPVRRRASAYAFCDLGGAFPVWKIGCLVSDLAMVYSHFGFSSVTPASIAAHGGWFDASGAIFNSALNVPGHRTVMVMDPSPEWIRAQVGAGHPVIVGMNLPSGGTHFVTLTGLNGASDYWVNDPWEQNAMHVAFAGDWFTRGPIYEAIAFI